MRYNPRTFGKPNSGGANRSHDHPLRPKHGDKPCLSWYASTVKDKPAMVLDWDKTLKQSPGLDPSDLEIMLQKEPGTQTIEQNHTTIYFKYLELQQARYN